MSEHPNVTIEKIADGFVMGSASHAANLFAVKNNGPIAQLKFTGDVREGRHLWTVEIPRSALNGGDTVIVIAPEAQDEILATLPITIGETAATNLSARVATLEAELALVKAALRRALRTD